jgi:hypothetical protein
MRSPESVSTLSIKYCLTSIAQHLCVWAGHVCRGRAWIDNAFRDPIAGQSEIAKQSALCIDIAGYDIAGWESGLGRSN